MGNSTINTVDVLGCAQEVIARCKKLAAFSEDLSGTTRLFLCPAMREVHREISAWMKSLGVEVRTDAAGNLRGLYPGERGNAPALLIGSHLDTVPNAGAYDGVLGVAMAIALLQALQGQKLPFGIEVIGFSEEEGVRFGTPFIGSRALVGRLDEALLDRRDRQGISVREAIEDFGLDSAEIAQAALTSNVLGYLEFHIEQGPVLESLGLPLGVVESIAGQSRVEFTFSGQSNHAGTTPMNLRRDALAAAAEWVVAVEKLGQNTPGLVATVGAIEAKPGAANVVAGETRVTLDVRHGSDSAREQAVRELMRQAEAISSHRSLQVRHKILLEQKSVAMDPLLAGEIEKAIQKTGCKPHRMVSGAGHDAMVLAEKVPAAMVFLRTPGGISHDPAESVAVEDVAKAIECGLHLLNQLASNFARN